MLPFTSGIIPYLYWPGTHSSLFKIIISATAQSIQARTFSSLEVLSELLSCYLLLLLYIADIEKKEVSKDVLCSPLDRAA